MAEALAKRWVCVFQARSGGHARALFATKHQAKQFAEQHAHAFIPMGVPLKWEDTTHDSSVLTTQVGDYLVTPIEEHERRS